MRLHDWVATRLLGAHLSLDVHGRVRRALLEGPGALEGPNRMILTPVLLERIADLYDRFAFDGALSEALAARSDRPLAFRVSTRLLRAGGTARRTRAEGGRADYVVSISVPLLRSIPAPDGGKPSVVGLPCADRLAALQRLLEHELLHVVEWLVSDHSNCRERRFHTLARNTFGHTESGHRLPSPRMVAYERHGIDVGDVVSLAIEDERYEGVVTRIGHRVTVRVEHHAGARAPDGRCYLKAYVPVEGLVRLRSAWA